MDKTYKAWDTNGGGVSQAEAYAELKNMPAAEARKIWDMFGWKTDYDTYIKNLNKKKK